MLIILKNSMPTDHRATVMRVLKSSAWDSTASFPTARCAARFPKHMYKQLWLAGAPVLEVVFTPSGKLPAPIDPVVRIVDHEVLIPRMNTSTARVPSANNDSHVTFMSFIDNVHKVVLTVVKEY